MMRTLLCTSWLICFALTLTGSHWSFQSTTLDTIVQPKKKDIKIKIYPNPATDFFTLEANIPIGKVEIFNIVAEKIKTIYSTDQEYNVAELPRGTYLVRIYNLQNQTLKTLRIRKR